MALHSLTRWVIDKTLWPWDERLYFDKHVETISWDIWSTIYLEAQWWFSSIVPSFQVLNRSISEKKNACWLTIVGRSSGKFLFIALIGYFWKNCLHKKIHSFLRLISIHKNLGTMRPFCSLNNFLCLLSLMKSWVLQQQNSFNKFVGSLYGSIVAILSLFHHCILGILGDRSIVVVNIGPQVKKWNI